MISPQAHHYRRQQRRWAGLMHLALGCFLVLVLILGGSAFAQPRGLVLVLPLVVGGYCCVRSVGALRRFRRAMAEDRKEQRIL